MRFPQVEVQQASNENLTATEIKRLFDIMIHAYAVTESEIWGDNYMRLTFEEFNEILDKKQLFVAFINDQVVGSIRAYPLSKKKYAFGLLSADFSESGKGIGRSLIEAIEQYAKEQGATIMELEILRPADIISPFKERLANWYTGMGYNFLETVNFDVVEPNRVEKEATMVNRSVFDCYQKEL